MQEDMLSALINKRIKNLKENDSSRYNQFLDRISDVAADNFMRFGFKDLNTVPLDEKIYHGCLFKHLLAADKASLDRWEAVINQSYNVGIVSDKVNEKYVSNALNIMMENCLSVENNSEQSTLTLLFKYILFTIGDIKFKKLDEDITDEMLSTWHSNLKLGWLMHNPVGLFVEKTSYNYYGMTFSKFFNGNKYDLEDLLIDNEIHTEDYESILALRIEVLLFAPYLLSGFNNATKQVKYN